MNHAEDLVKLTVKDGSWPKLEDQWRTLCTEFDEDFKTYALDAMPVLQELAANHQKDAGVYALVRDGGEIDAVCQAHATHLPGYTGKVLRVRHLLLSPYFDFGDYPIEQYVEVLSRMFGFTVKLGVSSLRSEHVKFHLRSPADRQFFEASLNVLRSVGPFDAVQIRGSWLYLTVKQLNSHPLQEDVNER